MKSHARVSFGNTFMGLNHFFVSKLFTKILYVIEDYINGSCARMVRKYIRISGISAKEV